MKRSLTLDEYDRAFRPAQRGFRIGPPHEAAISHLGAARGDATVVTASPAPEPDPR
jgi:hypothetical protein